MFEFVNSGLYFVRDENNLINQLLYVGSGSGANGDIQTDRQTSKVVLSAAFCSQKYISKTAGPSFFQ